MTVLTETDAMDLPVDRTGLVTVTDGHVGHGRVIVTRLIGVVRIDLAVGAVVGVTNGQLGHGLVRVTIETALLVET